MINGNDKFKELKYLDLKWVIYATLAYYYSVSNEFEKSKENLDKSLRITKFRQKKINRYWMLDCLLKEQIVKYIISDLLELKQTIIKKHVKILVSNITNIDSNLIERTFWYEKHFN